MSTRFAITPASFGATHASTGLRDVVRLIARVYDVHVSRRELAELDPRLLRDIGTLPGEARAEATRAPWDIRPQSPRRGGDWGRKPSDGYLTAMRESVRVAFRRWRTRQSIAGLDQHALRDIGVSYAEAENEANKAFWQR